MSKVHISTLTNKELKLLIEKTITKRGMPKPIVKLLLETYSLVIMIDKGWFATEHIKKAKEMAIKNIAHATGDYVIKPVEGK